MLTISQLASHAGVTVPAVRHYHRIGLLPEPARDRSGYRSYDAAALVRLIRIHVLASASVPLARIETLLEASEEEFAAEVRRIDAGLRAEVRRIQEARRRLARLAAGEQLALPACVVGYLDRLRSLGVAESYLSHERDAWILVAAKVPDQIEEIMQRKHRDLDDPDTRALYTLIGTGGEISADDPRIEEAAEVLDRILGRARPEDLNVEEFDDPFVDLMDTAMAQSGPAAARLLDLLAERGWHGWTRLERR